MALLGLSSSPVITCTRLVKIYGPYVVTLLNWTTTFVQYRTRLIVKNTNYNEIGLYAQNIVPF
jgi:hypothetical protein